MKEIIIKLEDDRKTSLRIVGDILPFEIYGALTFYAKHYFITLMKAIKNNKKSDEAPTKGKEAEK